MDKIKLRFNPALFYFIGVCDLVLLIYTVLLYYLIIFIVIFLQFTRGHI